MTEEKRKQLESLVRARWTGVERHLREVMMGLPVASVEGTECSLFTTRQLRQGSYPESYQIMTTCMPENVHIKGTVVLTPIVK